MKCQKYLQKTNIGATYDLLLYNILVFKKIFSSRKTIYLYLAGKINLTNTLSCLCFTTLTFYYYHSIVILIYVTLAQEDT